MIQHPRVFGINTADIARAKDLLEKVSRLDRLPRQQSLAGLLLLRECWDEHDIAMHWANRYKLYSHVSYHLLLVLGVVTIILVSVQSRVNAYYGIQSAIANANNSYLPKARFNA